MTGVELLEKLVLLIPPTYANLTPCDAVRRRTSGTHGVFAPTSRLREKVVPTPASTSDDAAPSTARSVPRL
jgi:hypothetical protein